MHVSSRYLARRVLSPVLLGLIGVAATVVPATASAANGSGAADHVYINDNTAGANTIAVFERHANGALTPLSARFTPGLTESDIERRVRCAGFPSPQNSLEVDELAL